MSDEYETMGRGELLARLQDWMKVATERGQRIVELEGKQLQLQTALDTARQRADSNAELIGQHDPTGTDHMHEMMEHAGRADAAETQRDALRAVVEAVWVEIGAVLGQLLGQLEVTDEGKRRFIDAVGAAPSLESTGAPSLDAEDGT